MDRLLVGSEYASHLTDADLALLASAAAAQGLIGGATGPVDASRLRGDPAALLRLLEHPGVSRAVLAESDAGPGRAVPASPFLVVAVFAQRGAPALASAGHLPERTGPRPRAPPLASPAPPGVLPAPAP